MQPGRPLSQDRVDEVEGQDHQGPRLQGAPAWQHRPEGRDHRAHRTHRPCGRPAREGRRQLAGDLREAGRPGISWRPHERQGLRSRPHGPGPRKEKGGRAAGEPRAALRDRARSGVPDGLGLRHGRRTGRRRAQDGVPRHGVPPLRQPPRRVLPQRAPGEPAHGDGPAPSWPRGSPARRPRTT